MPVHRCSWIPCKRKLVSTITCAVILACSIGLSLRWTAADSIDPPAARTSPAPQDAQIDFERHVAPLFSRLGCNGAACHGAFGGKGGFQLSLFGYSAKMDYQNLLDRIDTDDPEFSLILQKPSGMEDHEGGVRFSPDSRVYQTIRTWVAQGANWTKGAGHVKRLDVQPEQVLFDATGQTASTPSTQLKVIAEFADGSRQDVTWLSQFTSRDEAVATVSQTGTVQPVRHGDTAVIVAYGNAFAAVSTLVPFPSKDAESRKPSRVSKSHSLGSIDHHILQKLNALNIEPSDRSSDEEFLRRVTLDTIGRLPTLDEIERFCTSESITKREDKIDELLAHPMHASLWATRMCDITKCDVNLMDDEERFRAKRAQMWHDWFRKRFGDNVPYDQIVRGIITATSRNTNSVEQWIQQEESTIRQGRESFDTDYADRPTLDLFWRRTSEDGLFPLEDMAELTAVAFTGVRMNCARCHKHPFDRWTQDDYAAFANIFSRVAYGNSTELNVAMFNELDRRRDAKQRGETVEPLPRLREVFVSPLYGREIVGAEEGKRVHPAALGGQPFDSDQDLRQQFYQWLVGPKNPYFAKSFVNRVWAIYFGFGMVEPVDDFSVANPPSHPRLLNELAESFRASGFDIRALEKQILMSDAYQRTSTPNESNLDDRRNFARQTIRPLMAEVALDTINQALGVDEDFGNSAPSGALAIGVGTNQPVGGAGKTLTILGRGQRQSICDCDRRPEPDLRQHVFLMNDASIVKKIQQGSIRQLLKLGDRKLVRRLYLRMVSRNPTERETQIALQYLGDAEDRESAFEDLVWSLLNTREFLTNH